MLFRKVISALLGVLALAACSKATPPVSKSPEKSPPSAIVAEASGEFAIDPALSVVRWEGKKILVPTKHTGTVALKEGTLSLEKGQLKSGSFALDMATISDEDLNGDSKAKLEGHLKSPDFFDVEKFPIASLTIKEALPAIDGKYKAKADLTIKGITKPIEFDATARLEGETLRSEAKIEINRALWDVRFGSGTFFKDLGDKIIDDTITFQVNLVAKKK